MWTDINTKPKHGLVFQVFQGHIMGIPAYYKHIDYFSNVPTSPPVLMLPLSKEQLASNDCVEEQMNGHILTNFRPLKLDQQNQESALSMDRPAKEDSSDVEVCLLTKVLSCGAQECTNCCIC